MVPMEIAGRRDAAARAAALLSEVGLTGRGHHYPSQLSGGEQQRIAHRPRARERPADPARRRADGQPRLGERAAHHGPAARRERAPRARRSCSRRTTRAWRAMAHERLALRDGRREQALMRFVIRMAVREIRASWRRLILFFLCIAVGVGGIVLLRSVVQNVRGGDRARRAQPGGGRRDAVDEPAVGREDARGASSGGWPASRCWRATEGVETNTMVRPADERRAVAKMAEVRGVQPAFPLYGTVELAGRPALLARAPEGPRRARPARAARAARVAGRRRDPDRDRPLHDPRRDRVGARTPGVGLQLRPAHPRRRRRPRGDRPAGIRQPGLARHPAQAAGARRRRRSSRSCGPTCAGSSSTSGRSAAPRIMSGRT